VTLILNSIISLPRAWLSFLRRRAPRSRSIDELACKLTGRERQIPVARDLAIKIKRTIRERVGVCLRGSIGLAPSIFLGKVASDIQKPDGLVVITAENLPDILLPLKLQDIYGIGPRMEERLKRAGITTVAISGRHPQHRFDGLGAV
jgi:DNA polymerase-4